MQLGHLRSQLMRRTVSQRCRQADRLRPVVIGLLLCLVCYELGWAQTDRYEPSYQNPTGREIVAVFISSSFCRGGQKPEVKAAVEDIKVLLSAWARENGAAFRVVGVSLDWQTDVGFNYLNAVGAFDEVLVGSNWYGLGAERFIFSDTARAIIPQMRVYEHEISDQGRWTQFTELALLKRIIGSDAIIEWAADGAPVP